MFSGELKQTIIPEINGRQLRCHRVQVGTAFGEYYTLPPQNVDQLPCALREKWVDISEEPMIANHLQVVFQRNINKKAGKAIYRQHPNVLTSIVIEGQQSLKVYVHEMNTEKPFLAATYTDDGDLDTMIIADVDGQKRVVSIHRKSGEISFFSDYSKFSKNRPERTLELCELSTKDGYGIWGRNYRYGMNGEHNIGGILVNSNGVSSKILFPLWTNIDTRSTLLDRSSAAWTQVPIGIKFSFEQTTA